VGDTPPNGEESMTAYDQLDQLRKDIAANPDSQAEAKARQKAVFAADTFSGSLRTYKSGSVAIRFTNHPVSDAGGGVVMDRRSFPALGPEGDGELPAALVEDLRDCIRPILKEAYLSQLKTLLIGLRESRFFVRTHRQDETGYGWSPTSWT